MEQKVEIFDMYAGSGKTTLLVDKIRELAEQGLSLMNIGFCSYTRTAREVIQKKAVELFDCSYEELDAGWFRTMDSATLEALKRAGDFRGLEIFTPQKKEHRDWLTDIFEGASGVRHTSQKGDLHMAVHPKYKDVLSAWNYARAVNETFIASYRRSLATSIQGGSSFSEDEACKIIEKLEGAKRIEGIVDFTDTKLMYAGFQASLEGNHTVKPKGVVPEVQQFFLDEWQDSNPLTNLVGKRLASSDECEKVTIAGDLNQSIFSFLGADRNPFEIWEPATTHKIKRSFRVPSQIGKWAEFALSRKKKVFVRGDYRKAADEVQWRDNMDGTYMDKSCFVQFNYSQGDIYWDFARFRYLYYDSPNGFGPDGDWLVLCRTNRSVDLTMWAMSKAGIPCYKVGTPPERSKWHQAFLTWHRLYKLGEGVTGNDMANFIRCVNENYRKALRREDTLEDTTPFPVISKRKKQEFAELHKRHKTKDVYFLSDLMEIGVNEYLIEFLNAQVCCTIRHSMCLFPAELNRDYDFPNEMVRYGPDLFGNPKTRISTIHKAKGLEADKVGILTNISRTAYMRCVKNPALWNEECNLMYVAMTRAKKGVLCMRKGDTEKSEGFNMPGVLGF